MTTENNMFYDTDTFDFFSLTDVKEQSEPSTNWTPSHTTGAEDASPNRKAFSDGVHAPELEPSLFEPEKPKETDPNSDTSDLMNGREEQKERQNDFFDLPDYAVIDLGENDYGEKVHTTKAEMYEYKNKKDELNAEVEFFRQASRHDVAALYNHMYDTVTREKTTIQLQREALQKAIDDPRTDESKIAGYYKDIKKLNEQDSIVDQRLGNFNQARQTYETELIKKNLHIAYADMKNVYGKQFENDAQNIIGYLVNQSGKDEATVYRNLTAGDVEMAMKARLFDQLNQQRSQTVKQQNKQYWSQSTPANIYTPNTSAKNDQGTKLLGQKGFRNSQEAITAFNSIVD